MIVSKKNKKTGQVEEIETDKRKVSFDEMSNFAQYLDKKCNGMIHLADLKLVNNRKYDPEPKLVQEKQAVNELNTHLSDIFIPFETELKKRLIWVEELFAAADKDKNYLMSCQELAVTIEVYTGYKLTERELAKLIAAARDIVGTTKRTELKKAELEQLLQDQIKKTNSEPPMG